MCGVGLSSGGSGGRSLWGELGDDGVGGCSEGGGQIVGDLGGEEVLVGAVVDGLVVDVVGDEAVGDELGVLVAALAAEDEGRAESTAGLALEGVSVEVVVLGPVAESGAASLELVDEVLVAVVLASLPAPTAALLPLALPLALELDAAVAHAIAANDPAVVPSAVASLAVVRSVPDVGLGVRLGAAAAAATALTATAAVVVVS